MDLNDGKFKQNGRAGYILKPRVQREGECQSRTHGILYTSSHYCERAESSVECACFTGELEISFARI